jgi:hypothetical protein
MACSSIPRPILVAKPSTRMGGITRRLESLKNVTCTRIPLVSDLGGLSCASGYSPPDSVWAQGVSRRMRGRTRLAPGRAFSCRGPASSSANRFWKSSRSCRVARRLPFFWSAISWSAAPSAFFHQAMDPSA